MPVFSYYAEAENEFFEDFMQFLDKHKEPILNSDSGIPSVQFAMSVMFSLMYLIYKDHNRELCEMSERCSSMVNTLRASNN